ncbi:MAG: 23S rRNA (adenine(2503)-C(2))-methyltransferase RlmN, partial [Gammaproteobacteria bacterium]
MTTPTVKHDVLGLSRTQWQSLLTDLGEKPFRATQIMKWLHHRSVDD